MANLVIYTTPSYTVKLKDIDATAMDLYVTLRQGSASVTLSGGDLSATYDGTDTSITFTLAQEDSAKFLPNRYVEVQVNMMNGTVRTASSIGVLDALKNLQTEVIE